MALELPPGVWFLRSKGGKIHPVTREGNWTFGIFAIGMVGSGLAGLLLGLDRVQPVIWISVMAVGAICSAARLFYVISRHTNYDIAYADYLKARTHA